VTERKTEHAIGFRIYSLPPGQQLDANYVGRNQPVGKTDQYINLREVSKRLQLPPGDYVVIPTTYAAGEQAEFLLRAFVEKYWGSSSTGDKQRVGGGERPQPVRGFQGRESRNVINIPIIREAGPGPAEEAGPGRMRKRDRLAKFGLDFLEKHVPAGRGIIGKLKEIYKFPEDRNQERDLLKDIINSMVK